MINDENVSSSQIDNSHCISDIAPSKEGDLYSFNDSDQGLETYMVKKIKGIVKNKFMLCVAAYQKVPAAEHVIETNTYSVFWSNKNFRDKYGTANLKFKNPLSNNQEDYLFDLLANFDCQSAKSFMLMDLNREGDQVMELVIEKFTYQE